MGRTRVHLALGALLALAGAALVSSSAPAAQAWPGELPALAASRQVKEPKIEFDPIPFGHDRKRQMAAYSKRHYGERTWRLTDPKAIVLHYTATDTYPPVFNTFASNAPNLGESPGVCAQFDDGRYCGLPCQGNNDCRVGYACTVRTGVVGQDVRVCTPIQ